MMGTKREKKPADATVRVTRQDVHQVKFRLLRELLLLTVPEAADILGCSDRKVFDLIRDGHLIAAGDVPGRKGIRITGQSMKEYVESITIAPEFWRR